MAEAQTSNIQEFTASALNKGEEGVVLKKKDAVYVPDKRPAWSSIKIKKMDFIDCICIGFEDATKQYSGKELNTWEYWVDLSGNPYHGRYLDDNGYATIRTPMFPVTKPYFYGWKTSMRLGALDNEGKIVEIGTVSSGLNDELKQDLSEEKWIYTSEYEDGITINNYYIDKGRIYHKITNESWEIDYNYYAKELEKDL